MPKYPLLAAHPHPSYNIVGIDYYQNAIRDLVKTLGLTDRDEASFIAELVPEPDNPYGDEGHAISVRFQGNVIGYLAQAKAHRYWQLCRISASGYTPTVPARIWGFWDAGRFRAWISISLPEPDCLYPLNDPPMSDWVLLPRTGSAQVTKEEDHLDILSEYLPESGTGILLTTLHIIEGGVRTHWPLIEVRVDDERVGELTRKMSEYYVPTVRHFDDLGVETVALTRIQGSSISIQLTLQAARAHDLEEDDLTPPENPPLPKLVPFQADADSYAIPNTYKPNGNEITYDNEQEDNEKDLEPVIEPSESLTDEVSIPPQDSIPHAGSPSQGLHDDSSSVASLPGATVQKNQSTSPHGEKLHPSPSTASTPEPPTIPASTWLPTQQGDIKPPSTNDALPHRPSWNRPKPIRRIISICCALFGLLMALFGAFTLDISVFLFGLTFLTPSLWWLYCEHADRQAAQKAKDASEARDYYKQLLDPEKDATIIAGMGTATAEPKPMNRRWPLVGAATVLIFAVCMALTPPSPTREIEEETTAPPTISVPSFTTEKPTPTRTTSQKTRETPTPIEEPVVEEAGLNTPEPIYEEPLYEEPAYEEPAYEEPETVGATYYSSCAEARAAGAAPLFAGAPGYRSGLDRDGDGVACEL